jgi:hypothetical protein
MLRVKIPFVRVEITLSKNQSVQMTLLRVIITLMSVQIESSVLKSNFNVLKSHTTIRNHILRRVEALLHVKINLRV